MAGSAHVAAGVKVGDQKGVLRLGVRKRAAPGEGRIQNVLSVRVRGWNVFRIQRLQDGEVLDRRNALDVLRIHHTVTDVAGHAVAIDRFEQGSVSRIAPARDPSAWGVATQAIVAGRRSILVGDRQRGKEDRIARTVRHHASVEIEPRLDVLIVVRVAECAEGRGLKLHPEQRLASREMEIAQGGPDEPSRCLENGEDPVAHVFAPVSRSVTDSNAYPRCGRWNIRHVEGEDTARSLLQVQRNPRI